ncbi:GNAT family N-acetyltransferase [Fulvivirgaceae bacterium PWU4]|uniref:GNAT family N-acetyltransferase n=1 Tax=Chryseosolibacter histidini TaxID=2782349 RepID=A0AAP2GIS2_9BACT|nr:GNAT family N-acetyltransferase [Chryseosolibacter histidini]MBT1697284.1 GNAT family N-acetyltransferase [Chryseosolibacter histidini]
MISIRKAVAADIAVIADFQLRLAHETENVKLDRAIVEKGLKALFDDPSKGTYYVAEYNGETAGCHLITFEWSEWRNGMVWWLQSVYVKESHRKNGVFRAMYDNLINLIQNDPAILGLRLYVDKTNARAQQVYASLGMNGEHYTVFEKMK